MIRNHGSLQPCNRPAQRLEYNVLYLTGGCGVSTDIPVPYIKFYACQWQSLLLLNNLFMLLICYQSISGRFK